VRVGKGEKYGDVDELCIVYGRRADYEDSDDDDDDDNDDDEKDGVSCSKGSLRSRKYGRGTAYGDGVH
jgi:hypothetical protein